MPATMLANVHDAKRTTIPTAVSPCMLQAMRNVPHAVMPDVKLAAMNATTNHVMPLELLCTMRTHVQLALRLGPRVAMRSRMLAVMLVATRSMMPAWMPAPDARPDAHPDARQDARQDAHAQPRVMCGSVCAP